jgi:hypothetical protein
MRRALDLCTIVLALASTSDLPRLVGADPARDLARVRLIVSTTAATAAITVGGAAIASYDSALIGGSHADWVIVASWNE